MVESVDIDMQTIVVAGIIIDISKIDVFVNVGDKIEAHGELLNGTWYATELEVKDVESAP